VLQSKSASGKPLSATHPYKKGACVKGSIFFQPDRGKWAIAWHCALSNKNFTITRYKGEFMYDRRIAEKCLAMIQSRWEEHQAGLCQFRIEEFTRKGFTDVIDYFQLWMRDFVEPNRTPATIRGYWSYYKNWICPFFEKHPVPLHEIQLDTLIRFMNFIKASPKSKMNVLMALHAMMDYAHRSRRIPVMPPFPKREDFGIIDPRIEWIPGEAQEKILDAIPSEHRPVFQWLMLHFRRPAEACALFKTDYDPINRAFTIRRSLSARKLINQTKTKKIHVIPAADEFVQVANRLLMENPHTPFLFVNPRARREGQRYTNESLNIIWKKACKAASAEIGLYPGTKHSSCTNFIEEGGTVDELQMLTDHARRESVLKYADITLRRKREIMRRRKLLQNSYNSKITSIK
jgi:hypothetical protein